MYFVDLVAVSLVYWIFIIAMLQEEWFIKLCRFGKVVLSDEAFHVIIFVSWWVFVIVRGAGVGVFGSGSGCEYSFMFSKHRRDSGINLSGRKGNFLCIATGVVGMS